MTHRLEDFPPDVQRKLRAALAAERAPRVDVVREHDTRAGRMGRDVAAGLAAGVPALQRASGTIARGFGGVAIGDPPVARRDGDTLWLSLPIVPRTKKNSSRGNGKVSAAAVKFAHLTRQFLAPHLAALALPLPEVPYNCAATFTTDTERADLIGLLQALADALQAHAPSGFAGVLTDDRWLRGFDGARQVYRPLKPGIVLTLTPLTDG
jgi:hypothetical protein